MIPREDWYPPFPEELRQPFRKRDLDLVGVSRAAADPGREAEYKDWVHRGHSGTMSYLSRHAAQKYRPEAILPGARSILFAGIGYYQEAAGPSDAPSGRIARYAWGRDYHRVLGGRLKAVTRELQALHPRERFLSGTDSTALAERHYAAAAGIGFVGRNGLLISGQYGSWFLVGEILTTLDVSTDVTVGGRHGGCPTGCRRCLDVCPTGALLGEARIDAARCISYLTIEHRGTIPQELRPLMGDWLFGCDLCQEVCPLNVRRRVTGEPDFLAYRAGSSRQLAETLAIRDHQDMVRLFAGSPLMRPGRVGLVRNACVVAANTRSVRLLPQLRQLCHDGDDVVREHARWAVEQLT